MGLWATAALFAPVAAAAPGEKPIRVTYRAPGDCPPAGAFLDEVLARTRVARSVASGEAATVFEVEVEQLGDTYVGRLGVESASGRSSRAIDGPTCAEVVSGLALIAALTVDPSASLAAQPALALPEIPDASKAAPPLPDTPGALKPSSSLPAALDAPKVASSLPEAAGVPTPSFLLTKPARTETPRHGRGPTRPGAGSAGPFFGWTAGLDGLLSVGIAPRAFVGAGPFVQVRAERPHGFALRLSVAYATTGELDAGRSRAGFVWSAGRLDGCPVTARPLPRLLLYPCAAAEGGLLRARGFGSPTIADPREVKIPWLSLAWTARARSR